MIRLPRLVLGPPDKPHCQCFSRKIHTRHPFFKRTHRRIFSLYDWRQKVCTCPFKHPSSINSFSTSVWQFFFLGIRIWNFRHYVEMMIFRDSWSFSILCMEVIICILWGTSLGQWNRRMIYKGPGHLEASPTFHVKGSESFKNLLGPWLHLWRLSLRAFTLPIFMIKGLTGFKFSTVGLSVVWNLNSPSAWTIAVSSLVYF